MDAAFGGSFDRNRGGLAAWLVAALALLLGAAPASQPAQQIRTWFNQLNDPDAGVREQAVQELMGLSREQLPLLQNVVAESRPLRPNQLAVLREVVSHVYISGADYPPEPQQMPFLGLQWMPGLHEVATAEGVIVTRRIPGFSAYRMLREGDVIHSIKELPNLRFTSTDLFGKAIQTFKAGQTITLGVIREGRSVQVPVTLRSKPQGLTLELGALDNWIESQQAQADVYWEQHFAPLINADAM